MLSGKARRRVQRITVGVIVGAVVISLALSLLSAAVAVEGRPAEVTTPAAPSAASSTRVRAADTPQPTPATTGSPLLGSSTDPKPVTKTPQGQATQVTDKEHIGGLIGFIAVMLGGLLLLLRGRARDRRERKAGSILS